MRKRTIALIVLGLLAIVLAANTVLVELDTEPADEDDIGRILKLPAGDIQITDDGHPDAPPIVLVHGFQASLRWWDGVTERLSREFRVIRVDLLGHGGSEKPRNGYSMEEQGDLVAQVMEQPERREGHGRGPLDGRPGGHGADRAPPRARGPADGHRHRAGEPLQQEPLRPRRSRRCRLSATRCDV